jgi:hypothetical protein
MSIVILKKCKIFQICIIYFYLVNNIYNTYWRDAMEESKVECPCYGNKTLQKARNYEICKICDWEDDELQYDEPDYVCGSNKMSLNEARKAYRNNEQVY